MASALESFVNSVRSLSQSCNFTNLAETVSKTIDALSKNASHLDNVLATLDIQQHSLGVLGILIAKYNQGNSADFEPLYVQTQDFILTCNGEQVRYATDMYADLCHRFTQALVERKQALRGIKVLVHAISKIQLMPSQLTSIHSDLCQLCLAAKCFRPALQFLDVDITDISKESGQYDAKYFLLYYYYGGMIYAALKNYERAVFFFENAVTTPSMAVSHIMLEAYKKFVLVSLILHGKIPTLPRYTSHVVNRYIRPLCQPYLEIASAYNSHNPSDLRSVVTRHNDIFVRDRNMGLVRQCITAVYKKNIQRLTKTFMTLSLTDMANRVQLTTPAEAERYVLHMIEDGEIFATINQKDGMVTFHDNPEKYNSVGMLMNLDQEVQKCFAIEKKLRAMDHEIMVNPQYVQKVSGMYDEDAPGSSMKMPVGHIM